MRCDAIWGKIYDGFHALASKVQSSPVIEWISCSGGTLRLQGKSYPQKPLNDASAVIPAVARVPSGALQGLTRSPLDSPRQDKEVVGVVESRWCAT